MIQSGNIIKMRTELANPVDYYLSVGADEVHLNPLVGKEIKLSFNGQINCISCGKQTKTSFGQGFCYTCMQTSPETSESILRPELSKSHFGIARDMDWAIQHDLIDHYVYLAHTGDIKVGVTRHHQIPTRWIDQGANSAVKIVKAPNRHIAGIIEVFLKNHFSDKTDWRAMLKTNTIKSDSLLEEKYRALSFLPSELLKYKESDDTIITIQYPIAEFFEKINNVSFDKQPVIEGILSGIKGQYLVFKNGNVLNIRKHNGYFITLELLDY
jgi:hypothetical protein